MSCTTCPSTLLYWQDPIKTGVIFGSVLLVLLALASYSLLSVGAYLALTLLTAVVGIKLYTFVMIKMGKAESSSDPLAPVTKLKLDIPEDAIRDHSDCIAKSINHVITQARSLFLVENTMNTIKFGLCLYVLTYIGAWFNALTLITLAWVMLFTLPKVYINNQAQVDEVLGQIQTQVDSVKMQVIDMLPASMKPAVIKKDE